METPTLDPETAFLLSDQTTGNEWELFKENVRPLKRGRKVALLNEFLKPDAHLARTKALFKDRKRLIEAIVEYKGEDPLCPWIECIKWVQESFPSGGECSGLVVIYEQCVRTFWHDDRYKEDLRYLKLWLEYAESCSDAEVIFRFLEANQIGQTKANFYVSYAFHMESKNKLRKADEIFNIGIARKANPVDKLESAYRKFLSRSTRRNNSVEEEPSIGDLPTRSFGAILGREENRTQTNSGVQIRRYKPLKERSNENTLFSIYDDSKAESQHQTQPKEHSKSWRMLGTRTERNKENNPVPSKWTSHKIPQRTGLSAPPAPPRSAIIPIFVDEECAEPRAEAVQRIKPSVLRLRQLNGRNLKKDTENLKENPLRNFPSSSLPR